MFISLYFTCLCLLAGIILLYVIVSDRKDCLTEKTPIGWWITGVAVSQSFFVAIPAIWWEGWWIAHPWILYVSGWITIIFTVLWAVLEYKFRGNR